MKVLINGRWFQVTEEKQIRSTERFSQPVVHYVVAGQDDGGNPMHGIVPCWLVEDTSL